MIMAPTRSPGWYSRRFQLVLSNISQPARLCKQSEGHSYFPCTLLTERSPLIGAFPSKVYFFHWFYAKSASFLSQDYPRLLIRFGFYVSDGRYHLQPCRILYPCPVKTLIPNPHRQRILLRS